MQTSEHEKEKEEAHITTLRMFQDALADADKFLLSNTEQGNSSVPEKEEDVPSSKEASGKVLVPRLHHRMQVTKRDGTLENMKFDEITDRLENLCSKFGLGFVDCAFITKQIVNRIQNRMRTTAIDRLCADYCYDLTYVHPHYHMLARAISISDNHKNTPATFWDMVHLLRGGNQLSPKFIDFVDEHKEALNALASEFSSSDYYNLSYPGIKLLKRSYLLKRDGTHRIVERPHYMYLRSAILSSNYKIEDVRRFYTMYVKRESTPATPGLMTSGLIRASPASCFVFCGNDPVSLGDSIEGMYDGIVKQCAYISKRMGGIGISMTEIRSRGSRIKTTNGCSSGIGPLLEVLNKVALHIDQGGGKRNGSIAVYIEPWHRDLETFLLMRNLNQGDPKTKAEVLFYGLWVPSLFYKRADAAPGEKDYITLFCPSDVPDLPKLYGEAFDKRYEEYEASIPWRWNDSPAIEFNEEDEEEPENMPRAIRYKAETIWMLIQTAIENSGMPYILNKDMCNRKSNEKHLGIIRSSNLCTEIILYYDDKEFAVCNLSSISLPKYVYADAMKVPRVYMDAFLNDPYVILSKKENAEGDYIKHTIFGNVLYYRKNNDSSTKKRHFLNCIGRRHFSLAHLYYNVRAMIRSMNHMIENATYDMSPVERCNRRRRPLGLGVQGLATVFQMMGCNYIDPESKKMNIFIFETIYFAALVESMNMAKEAGSPCEAFYGSPLSQGLFQFDLWFNEDELLGNEDQVGITMSGFYDWETLRKDIMKYGIYNSTLIAPMPTASTSRIGDGISEGVDPIYSNWYKRNTISGENIVFNNQMMEALLEMDMWTPQVQDSVFANNGSLLQISKIVDIPQSILEVFMTAFESSADPDMNEDDAISDENELKKHIAILSMARDRGHFICQSQSMNLYLRNVDNLMTILFMGHKFGLKTGMYYLRQQIDAENNKSIMPSIIYEAMGGYDETPVSTIASSSSSSSSKETKDIGEAGKDKKEDQSIEKKKAVDKKEARTKRKVVCDGNVCLYCE